MEHEHYSYPEALRYVAKRYGIEIEEEEITPEMQQQLDEKESMLALNSFITEYFKKNLFEKNEGKAIGLSYLKERESPLNLSLNLNLFLQRLRIY